jgi:3-deoxy-manno-octulosonate cytidylyltransferase (CMP-KDO synthetase)
LVRDDASRRAVEGLHYIHLGLYMYRRDTLLKLASLPTGRLEDAEKLEQLRALEHGIPIRVWETNHASLRVDTPEDVEAVAEKLQQCDVIERELGALKAAPSR